MGVFDSIAHQIPKSSELFGDLDPRSLQSLPFRRPRVVRLVTYGQLAGVPSVFELKLFNLDAQQLIQSNEHALAIIQVGENEADVMNEICISENRKTLAFSLDGGAVGVVDLATNNVRMMKARHDSICAIARFIPNRPSELVSGGYDSTLLHFDFRQGTILSRRECSPTSPPQSSDISLSPPFVLCLAISSTGAIAAGTADGCLWIGLGGDKRVSSKKTRKWGGLREDMGLSRKIAEGPIVALAFLDPSTIITSTLLGVLSRHNLSIEGNAEDWRLESIAIGQTQSIVKVNGLVVHDDNIVVGGFMADGKGAAEVYKHSNL